MRLTDILKIRPSQEKKKEKGKEILPRSLETLPKFVSKANCFRGASKQAF
jgi:hypothetical protein